MASVTRKPDRGQAPICVHGSEPQVLQCIPKRISWLLARRPEYLHQFVALGSNVPIVREIKRLGRWRHRISCCGVDVEQKQSLCDYKVKILVQAHFYEKISNKLLSVNFIIVELPHSQQT